jgi:hypothetical protein
MTLQERIKKNSLYIVNIQITNGMNIVEVQYGNKWGVYGKPDGTINVAPSEQIRDRWFYYSKIDDTSIDDIIDLIERTIADNLTAEMKVKLFEQKVDEMKKFFDQHQYEELTTLEFKIKAKKKSTKKTKKSETPADVSIQEVVPNKKKTVKVETVVQ